MPVESGYNVAVVIVNAHEPEGEVGTRLLELADEKDYSPRVVEAQRGEHDAGLSFRVPSDVAEAFERDRSKRWPSEPVDGDDAPVAGVDEDAYAAEHTRAAQSAQAANAESTTPEDTTTARSARPGKKE